MQTQLTHKELVNRVFALFGHSTLMTTQWLAHLLDADLDRQGELRNKIFSIFVTGLIDGVWEPENRIQWLEREAKRLKNLAALRYLDYVRSYLAYSLELAGLFSRAEIIFIREHRDQLVHTVLDETHKRVRTVRFVDGGKLVSKKIAAADYWNDWRSIVEGMETVEEAITALRRRLYEHKTLFWVIDGAFRNTREAVRQDLHDGQRCSINMTFPRDPVELKNATEKHGLTLIDVRTMNTIEGDLAVDPVIAAHK